MTTTPHYAIHLWKDIAFRDLSPTAKRIMVAHWMNSGVEFIDLPHLIPSDRTRAGHIRDEEGQEVLQDILLSLVEAERENRVLRRRLADYETGRVKPGATVEGNKRAAKRGR